MIVSIVGIGQLVSLVVSSVCGDTIIFSIFCTLYDVHTCMYVGKDVVFPGHNTNDTTPPPKKTLFIVSELIKNSMRMAKDQRNRSELIPVSANQHL